MKGESPYQLQDFGMELTADGGGDQFPIGKDADPASECSEYRWVSLKDMRK